MSMQIPSVQTTDSISLVVHSGSRDQLTYMMIILKQPNQPNQTLIQLLSGCLCDGVPKTQAHPE
jgi:hypothetical protein